MNMKRSQVVVIVVALLAIVGIYFLPRVVVKEENNSKQLSNTSTPEPTVEHNTELSEASKEEIGNIKAAIQKSSGKEKKAATLQLAQAFTKLQKFDSAAHYLELLAKETQDTELYLQTGNAYYEALTFAVNSEKAAKMAEKARYWLDKAAEANPANVEAKAKSALTYINGEAPMQGILKLRALAEEHPENEFVQYNMGILSYQSQQYDKAESRFAKVVAINPKSVNGYFYLALSQKELGKKSEAIKNFKKAAELDKSEEIQTSVKEQLAELQNN